MSEGDWCARVIGHAIGPRKNINFWVENERGDYVHRYAGTPGEIMAEITRLKAVNEELVRALEAVHRVMRNGIVGEEARKAWAMVRTALAKAKELK